MGTELLFRFGFVNFLGGELLFPFVSVIFRTRTLFRASPGGRTGISDYTGKGAI